MKIIVSHLLRSTFFILFAVLSSSSLNAGSSNKSGNPYGNGTFFPSGTVYSATMRGTNGFLGIVQFSSASSSGTNSGSNSLNNSFAIVYANGQQYTGQAFGSVDPSSSTISCVYQLGVVTSTTFFFSNSVATISSTNFSCGGQFSGKIANAYPIQTFTATGEASMGTNNSTNNSIYQTQVTGCSINN
jgi:hypothetical protein